MQPRFIAGGAATQTAQRPPNRQGFFQFRQGLHDLYERRGAEPVAQRTLPAEH